MISGIGVVSPLGCDREATWSALLAGQRAGRWLTPQDLGVDRVWPGTRFSGNPAIEPANRHQFHDVTDRVIRLGLFSAAEAEHDASLALSKLDRSRIGCVFGTSKGGLHSLDAAILGQTTSDWLTGWPSTAAAMIASQFDLRGPCVSPVAACATGVAAIVRGMLAIQTGECDVVFAGSADDSLHPGVLSSFRRLGVLARSDDPATACRPFDRTRQGFVVGAGAACLILERRSHAEQRGASWYAEIHTGRLGTDPAGITQLDECGDSLTHLITATCRDIRPDFVQLHGTGTRTNDPVECRAVQSVFGDAAQLMLAGGIKGAIGHLLGAAGSVETAMTCLTLRDQIVPPCANLMDVDPVCDLPFVQNEAVTAPIQTALKLSLGFGGHQAAILLRRGNRRSR